MTCIIYAIKMIKEEKKQTYWVRDYSRYLNFEDIFKPNKLKEYKRGDIIKVNFGFNLGNEEGGLHYALVVENGNSQSSGVVTVIPLSTEKPGEELSNYEVSLGNELNILVKSKANTVIKMCQEQSEKSKKELDEITLELESIEKSNEALEQIINEASIDNEKETSSVMKIIEEKNNKVAKKMNDLRLEIEDINKRINYAKRIIREVNKMNYGSKALVGQITTISKMRIFDPKNSSDVLAGIKVSSEQLDKVNKKIIELYTFGIDKDKEQ